MLAAYCPGRRLATPSAGTRDAGRGVLPEVRKQRRGDRNGGREAREPHTRRMPVPPVDSSGGGAPVAAEGTPPDRFPAGRFTGGRFRANWRATVLLDQTHPATLRGKEINAEDFGQRLTQTEASRPGRHEWHGAKGNRRQQGRPIRPQRLPRHTRGGRTCRGYRSPRPTAWRGRATG